MAFTLLARTRALAFAALLCAHTACHLQRGASDSEFVRVSTPHFVVYTDVAPRLAKEHARTLETTLEGLLDTGWDHHGKLPLKLNVVLLRDPDDFARYAGHDLAGYFKDEVLFEPWAVLPAPRHKFEFQVLTHELSHHLAFLALQDQPVWYAEGLAVYYQTARLDGDRFRLGEPQGDYLDLLGDRGLLPAQELFVKDAERSARFYATAWLLVHYLMSERGDDFVRYQSELANGVGHARAWQSVFGLSAEQIDALLRDYYARDEYAVLDAPFHAAPFPVETEALAWSQEEGLRAVLWATCAQGRCSAQGERRLRQHIERALSLDPAQPEARLLQAELAVTDDERRAILRPFTRVTSQDYRGWLALALVEHPQEAKVAVERALALAPEQPATWLAAGRLRYASGDLDGALKSVERALRLRPRDAAALGAYAQLLFAAHRCVQMQTVLDRLRSLERASPTPEAEQRLVQLSLQCSHAAGPHNPPH